VCGRRRCSSEPFAAESPSSPLTKSGLADSV
jgi:hypothetical protein